jgi:hypothetical protein
MGERSKGRKILAVRDRRSVPQAPMLRFSPSSHPEEILG